MVVDLVGVNVRLGWLIIFVNLLDLVVVVLMGGWYGDRG